MHLAKPGKSCARCFFTCTISRTDLPEDGRASRQLTQFASEPVTQESLCSDCRAFGTRESWCAGRATSPALVAALAIEAFKLFQQTVSHCFQGTQYWLGRQNPRVLGGAQGSVRRHCTGMSAPSLLIQEWPLCVPRTTFDWNCCKDDSVPEAGGKEVQLLASRVFWNSTTSEVSRPHFPVLRCHTGLCPKVRPVPVTADLPGIYMGFCLISPKEENSMGGPSCSRNSHIP